MDEGIAKEIFKQYGPVVVVLLFLAPVVWKLFSDLTKLRIQMDYQLNRDLLTKRFEAYGNLWSHMHAIAIYSTKEFGPEEVTKFSEELSKWYFSATGGMLLTSRARDFYFSLQQLLTTVGSSSSWWCARRPAQSETKTMFAELLRELNLKDQQLKNQVDLVQQQPELLDPVSWSLICGSVSGKLKSIVDESKPNAGEVIYAAIQQVSSVLRTNLAFELRSRLDVEWPVAR